MRGFRPPECAIADSPDQIAGQVRSGLRQGTETGRNHDHAAIGNQAQPQHFGVVERQQHFFRRFGRSGVVPARRGVRVVTDQLLQRLGVGQRKHAHLALWLLPARRFQPDLGHGKNPMQQGLVQGDVVDAFERDVPHVLLQQSAADDDALGIQPEAIGEVLEQRDQRQCTHADQRPQLVAVAAATEQQHEQRQRELLELLQQHEQP